MFENKPKFGPEHYAAGAVIIQQGDVPDKFYIITKGEVVVLDEPVDDLPREIGRLRTGDYFGEVGMLTGGRRLATVQAETAVDLMAMDYGTFRNWINSSPMIAEEISEVMAERLQALDDAGLVEATTLDEIPVPETAAAPKSDTAELAAETAEKYAPETVIIRQGDPPDKFYIIVEGVVAVSHRDASGRERIIAYLDSGDYFGEIGLLEGGERIATVRALTQVRVVSFTREVFQRWMAFSPDSQDEIAETAARRRRDTGMLSQPDESNS